MMDSDGGGRPTKAACTRESSCPGRSFCDSGNSRANLVLSAAT